MNFHYLPSRAFTFARRGSIFCVFCVTSALALGCQNADETTDPLGAADPPTLVAEGATNARGQRVEATVDRLDLGCSGQITFHWGPRDRSGQLENWLLRPPGGCGDVDACGRLRVEVANQAGETLVATEAAVLDVLLDLDAEVISQARQVTATLVSGEPSKDYLVKGQPVQVSWALSLEADSCLGMAGSGSL